VLRQVVAFDVAPLLLPADPRAARYAVIRSSKTRAGIEGFLLDRAILLNWTVRASADDHTEFAQRLLAFGEPRTSADDVDVVLRWFGAQRPPAHVVLLPEDSLGAADAIEKAVLDLSMGEA
jgi:hypothetical protein